MKRRNLIYGMGLLAMGSGAAALSGATLSNTVNPFARFNINVEGGLLVTRGLSFDGNPTNTTSSGVDDATNVEFVKVTGDETDTAVANTLDFDQQAFEVAADAGENADLSIALAVPYGSLSGTGSYTFPNLLQITNNANSPKDVAIEFDDVAGGTVTDNDTNGFATGNQTDLDGSGSAVSAVNASGGSGPTRLSFDEVASLFQFKAGTTAISPAGSGTSAGNTNLTAANAVEIASGDTQQVSLTVDLTTEIKGKLDDIVSENNLSARSGHFALVEEIYVGTSSAGT
jgi:hypothetical protein